MLLVDGRPFLQLKMANFRVRLRFFRRLGCHEDQVRCDQCVIHVCLFPLVAGAGHF